MAVDSQGYQLTICRIVHELVSYHVNDNGYLQGDCREVISTVPQPYQARERFKSFGFKLWKPHSIPIWAQGKFQYWKDPWTCARIETKLERV